MPTHQVPVPLKALVPLEGVYVLSVPNPIPHHTARLSPAEREIVHALLDGCSNQEIAVRRHTSVKTVANQLAKLFEQFAVHSRMELLRKLEGSPNRA